MESNILRSPIWDNVQTSSAWIELQLPVYRCGHKPPRLDAH